MCDFHVPVLNDVDKRIWNDELDGFVPKKVYDVHTHIYRWSFNRDPEKETSPYRPLLGTDYANATFAALDACDRALFPGRQVSRLAFPFPFPHDCDFAASNEFVAAETSRDPNSGALMLVHPGMSPDSIERDLRRAGFLGLKPYRFYSRTGDATNCRITDFLPVEQVEIADRHGLLIMMHVSKRDAIADPENLREMEELTARFPGAKWILAHCARSYSAWAIERAASVLRRLENVWYDVSSVCESDAIEALLACVGSDRVMYGSDDLPVGMLRGKYITFGFAWGFLSESNHSIGLAHCDGQMTFTRYEQVRAMRRAALRLGLSRRQIDALFYDTAANLVASVRRAN